MERTLATLRCSLLDPASLIHTAQHVHVTDFLMGLTVMSTACIYGIVRATWSVFAILLQTLRLAQSPYVTRFIILASTMTIILQGMYISVGLLYRGLTGLGRTVLWASAGLGLVVVLRPRGETAAAGECI